MDLRISRRSRLKANNNDFSEEGVDRGRGRKTIIERTGMDIASSATRATKTGQDGNGLLRSHLWCPNDLAKLWDRLE